MTEAEITEVRKKLHVNTKGPLRKLFYQRNGLPKQGVLSNTGILKKLGVDMEEVNSLERKGIMIFLGSALAHLRKQAKDASLAWIDIEHTITQTKEGPNGALYDASVSIARHGFLTDIEKIKDNADKFDGRAVNHKAIADQTRDIYDMMKRGVEE